MGDVPEDSGWVFVINEDADGEAAIPPEALAAAPPEVAHGGRLLPRRRITDRCRLCGTTAQLSREHIPPQSAGNVGRVVSYSLMDWLARASLDDVPGGVIEQGGLWGRTLCESCNSRTGRYSREYAGWAARAARMMVEDLPPSDELDRLTVSKALTVRFERVRPGAFARQVLSLMASASGPWDLAGRHPEVADIVLDGSPGSLPPGMALGMTFYQGPNGLVSGPFVSVDRDSGEWKWSVVVAFPPLAFELELVSCSSAVSPLCDIGAMLEVDPAIRADVELEVFIAFGHTAMPTDWRTRAQIEGGLDLEGRPD